jgi:hypothetical protein
MKVLVIFTSKDNKTDRFIKHASNNEDFEQEWVDGWGFNQENIFMLRINDESPIGFNEFNCFKTQLKNLLKDENGLKVIIWVNRKNFNKADSLNSLKVLIEKTEYKITIHNTYDVFKNVFNGSQNYSLEASKKRIFIKVFTNEMLNPNAKFEDIEEAFFGTLSKLKKKLIDTFLPLAVDIQGLNQMNKDGKGPASYFKDIKASLDQDLKDFPNGEFCSLGWGKIEKLIDINFQKFKPNDLVQKILTSTNLEEFKNDEFLKPGCGNCLFDWIQHVVHKIELEIVK